MAMNRPMDRLKGKDRIKVLFIRAPHHHWPLLNDSDNTLVPLNYPTLAAWIREKLDFVDVEILDCCAERVGFKSLGAKVLEKNPDVVGIGDKVPYAHEAIRALNIVKGVKPDTVTVGGGHLFSFEPEWSLENCPSLDYIIRFEGEIALEKFLRRARDGDPEENIPSLCWRKKDGTVGYSELAPVVENLDDIPIPAFDLMLMDRYSPFGKLWPRSSTIQRGRGCIGTCNFCSWLAMESKHEMLPDGTIKTHPWYRSKSVGRVIEEIDLLYNKYNVRYLMWVDATLNLNDDWLREFCEEVIRRGYNKKLFWWAFIRYDQFPRQHKNGVLKLMETAGLRYALMGVERPADSELKWLNKKDYGHDLAIESIHILRDHYPRIFRHATYMPGIRTDTKESIQAILKHVHACDVDFTSIHPCTPYPGTPLYYEAKEKGWIGEWDFKNYDMLVPIMETEHLSRDEVNKWAGWVQQNFVARKPLRYLSRLFSPYQPRRRLHWWFLRAISSFMIVQLWDAIRGKEDFKGFTGLNKLMKPPWYET